MIVCAEWVVRVQLSVGSACNSVCNSCGAFGAVIERVVDTYIKMSFSSTSVKQKLPNPRKPSYTITQHTKQTHMQKHTRTPHDMYCTPTNVSILCIVVAYVIFVYILTYLHTLSVVVGISM